ncbi:hypothetical protein [Psychromarinibacter sp. S121]|uniref:hypothetical protein n=1 Tax=Psychromarinibacter sp. S121 TaxID=3415127 RepID=UPI003C7BA0FF
MPDFSIKLPSSLTPDALRRPPLTVSDTGWGYIIRSSHPTGALPERAVSGIRAGAVALCAAIALLLPGGLALKAVLCLLVMGALRLGLRWVRVRRAYEVQVDLRRRELRFGFHDGGGGAWIIDDLRFDEVGGSAIRREGDMPGLWLKLRSGETVAVAVAGREALIGVSDRLMRDVLPVVRREIVPVQGNGARARSVFPPLAPQEMT